MNELSQDHVPPKHVMLATVTVPPDFQALAKQHRRALHVHCYRMVGSFSEAEDLVQDTLVRAWTAYGAYDPATGEAGFRRWLYRIATNACLDFLKSANRKLTASARSFSEVPWLTPYPDRLLDELATPDASPEAAAAAKQTIALGYLAVIQLLPAQQRAVLVLREVLQWKAAEVGEAIGASTAAVNSLLQRARAQLDAVQPSQDRPLDAPESPEQQDLLGRYIEAFETYDMDKLVELFTTEAVFEMPPFDGWYQGPADIVSLSKNHCPAEGPGDMRFVRTTANGQPAAALYMLNRETGAHEAFQLHVLEIAPEGVAHVVAFHAGDGLFEKFGLPERL
jgi:RNA polymerase sigma-70 factor (ECF subfamily)